MTTVIPNPGDNPATNDPQPAQQQITTQPTQTPTPPPQPPKSRKKLFVVVIVVLLLLLTGGGAAAYFLLIPKGSDQTNPSPSPTPEAMMEDKMEEDPTADWETYAHSNFSLKLPSEWSIDNNYQSSPQQTEEVRYVRQASQNTDFTIMVGSSTETDWFELSSQPESQTTIDGTNGTQRTGYGGIAGSVYIIKTIVTNNNKTYTITLTTLDPELSKNIKQEYDQILSTFEFTDSTSQVDTSNWQTYTNENLEVSFRFPNTWRSCPNNNQPSYFIRLNEDCSTPGANSLLTLTGKEDEKSVPEYSPPGVANAYNSTGQQTIILGSNEFTKQSFTQVESFKWNETTYPPGPQVFFYSILDTRSNRLLDFYKPPSSTVSENTINQILSTFQFTN